jgi:hypothetical protein
VESSPPPPHAAVSDAAAAITQTHIARRIRNHGSLNDIATPSTQPGLRSPLSLALQAARMRSSKQMRSRARDVSLWSTRTRGTDWWRRRDSFSISFEMGWTMPSSGSRQPERRSGACYPNPSCDPNPSAGSGASLSLSMSLYRAREVGLPTPLGVATSLIAERQRVHRMSPVITLLSRAKATIALIEPASVSPLPSALHA